MSFLGAAYLVDHLLFNMHNSATTAHTSTFGVPPIRSEFHNRSVPVPNHPYYCVSLHLIGLDAYDGVLVGSYPVPNRDDH